MVWNLSKRRELACHFYDALAIDLVRELNFLLGLNTSDIDVLHSDSGHSIA